MSLVTAGYSGDSGIYRRLQELKDAEPFKPFYISMSDGKDHKVYKAGDLIFHESGLPQVKKSGGRLATLNPDHIIAITVGIKGSCSFEGSSWASSVLFTPTCHTETKRAVSRTKLFLSPIY